MITGLKRVVKSILYNFFGFALNKKCSVCGKKVIKFYPVSEYFLKKAKMNGWPYGVEDAETLNAEEYSCPHCGATDRERLYALYIEKEILPNREYKVLDIAPAHALRNYLRRKKNVIYRCADLFDEDVDDRGLDVMDMRIYNDGSFDIFICSHVLEHVMDDRKAMDELKRILKQDGFGIAMVPIIVTAKDIDEDIYVTDPSEKWRRFGQDDHVRLYTPSGFMGRLKEIGFKVKRITVKDFNEAIFKLHGITPKSVLYIVTK